MVSTFMPMLFFMAACFCCSARTTASAVSFASAASSFSLRFFVSASFFERSAYFSTLIINCSSMAILSSYALRSAGSFVAFAMAIYCERNNGKRDANLSNDFDCFLSIASTVMPNFSADEAMLAVLSLKAVLASSKSFFTLNTSIRMALLIVPASGIIFSFSYHVPTHDRLRSCRYPAFPCTWQAQSMHTC